MMVLWIICDSYRIPRRKYGIIHNIVYGPANTKLLARSLNATQWPHKRPENLRIVICDGWFQIKSRMCRGAVMPSVRIRWGGMCNHDYLKSYTHLVGQDIHVRVMAGFTG